MLIIKQIMEWPFPTKPVFLNIKKMHYLSINLQKQNVVIKDNQKTLMKGKHQ